MSIHSFPSALTVLEPSVKLISISNYLAVLVTHQSTKTGRHLKQAGIWFPCPFESRFYQQPFTGAQRKKQTEEKTGVGAAWVMSTVTAKMTTSLTSFFALGCPPQAWGFIAHFQRGNLNCL